MNFVKNVNDLANSICSRNTIIIIIIIGLILIIIIILLCNIGYFHLQIIKTMMASAEFDPITNYAETKHANT
jgi:uncharacterized membrane protein